MYKTSKEERTKEYLNRFRSSMKNIEKQIVRDTKEIRKLLKQAKQCQNENQKRELMNQVNILNTRLQNYIQVIEDLRYAIVERNVSRYADRIIKKAGCTSREEYLSTKANGVQPSIEEIVEIISLRMMYIDDYYSRDENGMVRRNDEIMNREIDTDIREFDTLKGQTHYGEYNEFGQKFDDNWNIQDTWISDTQNIGEVGKIGSRR